MTGPAAADPERLFEVFLHAGTGWSDGSVSAGTGAGKIEMTPLQLLRLMQTLSPASIKALALVLLHGEVKADPLRVEVIGYSVNWLMEMGLNSGEAQRASKELKGRFVRLEKVDGRTLGKQRGVLLGQRLGLVDPPAQAPRGDGRTRTDGPTDHARRPAPASSNPRSVDPTLSTDHGFTGSTDRGFPDPLTPSPQVSAVSTESGNGLSTALSRGEEDNPEDFYACGANNKIEIAALDRFLNAPAVRQRLARSYEQAVAALLPIFEEQPARASAILGWVDREGTADPAMALARVVVDVLTVTDDDLPLTGDALAQFLLAHNVRPPGLPHRQLLLRYAVCLISSVASDLHTPGGWLYRALRNDTWLPTKALTAAVEALQSVAAGRAAPAQAVGRDAPEPVLGADPVPASRPAAGADPSYTDRLRAAASGTIWADDEVMFQKLLLNPGAQRRVLADAERQQPA